MYKIVLALLLSIVLIESKNIDQVDNDFDGIYDNEDLCLNTSILDLVDANGCSKIQTKLNIIIEQTMAYTKISNDNFKSYDLMLLLKKYSYNLYFVTGYSDYQGDEKSSANILGISKNFVLENNDNIIVDFSTIFEKDDTNSFSYNFAYGTIYNNIFITLGFNLDKISTDTTSYENLSIGKDFDKFNINFTYNKSNNDTKDSLYISLKYDSYDTYYIIYTNKKYFSNSYDTTHQLSLGYRF